MKLRLFLILILLSPYAYGAVDDYNNYSSLEININMSSFADPMMTGNNAKIDTINISMMFRPGKNYMQEIIKEDTYISSEGRIIKNENSFNFFWDKPKIARYEFGVDYDIRTKNEIIKVDKKIKFPIEKLDESLAKYTMPTEFIDINNEIRKKAAQIAEGEDDYYNLVYNLAEWVNDNVNYSLNTLTEDVVEKSSWVMDNRYGVCDELTNLFISMARSLGIPARFVTGVVYTNIGYKFGNHGWAEIYFPDYGWLPFDVTYGQYGWIDSSHVKFFDSVDSGMPSVSYVWRSTNVEVKTYDLIIDSNVAKTIGNIDKKVDFSIKPLIDSVKFGSYFPLELNAKNMNPYYIAMTFRIRKAPGVYNGTYSKSMLLKPNEEKKMYWILTTPEIEDSRYIYTSEIEVDDYFGHAAKNKVKYASIYESYNLAYAKNLIDSLAVDDKKELLADIDFNCNSSKEYVYSNEDALIYCKINNIGNKNLNGVRICMLNNCKEVDLLLRESKRIVINNNFKSNGDFIVTVSYGDKAKYSKINIHVVKKPVVAMKKPDIKKLGYNEDANISLELMSNTKINNITIAIASNKINLEDLEGKYVVTLPVKGKMFLNKPFGIDLRYKDEVGKYYFLSDKISIEVVELPWYIRTFKFLF